MKNLLEPKRPSRRLAAKKMLSISDRTVASIFLCCLAVYVVLFGIYKFHAIYTTPLNLASLIILVPIFLTDIIKMCVEVLAKKPLYPAVEDTSDLTVIIPTMNGENTLGPTIDSLLRKLDKSRIIVVSNGSTDNTVALARSYPVPTFDIPYPIGKVESINRGLELAETTYVMIIDDDTIVDQAILPTNLLDEGYEGVALRVLPIKKGWVSTMQLHEYRKSMDISRGFHNATGTVQSISGAIGLFHTKELKRQIALHTGEFSGEDLQRTLLIHTGEGSKGVVIADSTVETAVPDTLWGLFKQRTFGWFPGQVANLRIYSKLLFRKKTPLRLKLDVFYNMILVTILDPLRIISLPVLLFSPTYLLIFYVSYVALETFMYVSLGAKDPYWIILLTPWYGLFNFVARVTASVVLIYRRISYVVSRSARYDDYTTAHTAAKLVSTGISSSLIASFLFGYSYISVIPGQYHYRVQLPIKAQKAAVHIPVAHKIITSPTPPVPHDFVYTIQSGDSVWRLSQQAVEDFLKQENIIMSKNNKGLLLTHIVKDQEDAILHPSETFTVPESLLKKEYASLPH